MFKKLFKNLFKDVNTREINRYTRKVEEINALENKIQKLSDDELKQKTIYFKNRIIDAQKGIESEEDKAEIIKQELNSILPEAFAIVREGARRVLGMRHFDVQLIGGMVLHDGKIAEMKTGEGKTLVATLPAYLNALSGKGVHIVTVNDYLVKRDAEWMGRLYNFLGISCGYIINETPQEKRKEEYEKDITYITNSELGFDYLRDNMRTSLDEMVIVDRGFNFAIVDEVDSILIDESRTPLIISGPTMHDPRLYIAVDKVVRQLNKDDYEIDEKQKNVQLSDKGNIKIEELLKSNGLLRKEDSLYDANSFILMNFIVQSLKAHTLFKNGVDYIVKNGKALIVDEFTGRIMEGRRYSDGLHQAIEAKEGIEVAPENQTMASITYQNFFRMYDKLSGMTGTATTEASEFYDIYKLPIVSIPTNKPIKRVSLDDLVYKNEEEKFNAIIECVKQSHSKGQPILIGTVSIEKSELLSSMLKREGIKHNLLNAKYHEKEAEIIAEAGRFGAVTIATNMAGRGTDIMLGGNVQKEIDKAIKKAQQENFEMMEKINKIEDIEERNKKLKELKTIDAEKIAEDVRNKHKDEYQKVVEVGGLFVIGSERHESRRIDNQLVGRSGRQGDPGKTQFFLSLHDDLLRIFGGEKIDLFLSRVGFKGGEAMNHPMLNSIINKSQKKVENFHYEIRKNLLKYDNIVNDQRKIIYNQRIAIVKSDNIDGIFEQIVNDVNLEILSKATNEEKVDAQMLKELLSKHYLINKSIMNFTNYELETINKFMMFIFRQKYSGVNLADMLEIQRRVILQTLDECWMEHLYQLDHIKEGIHLRAYAHKDPFSEYKFESYNLMQKTMDNFIMLTTQRMFNLKIDITNE